MCHYSRFLYTPSGNCISKNLGHRHFETAQPIPANLSFPNTSRVLQRERAAQLRETPRQFPARQTTVHEYNGHRARQACMQTTTEQNAVLYFTDGEYGHSLYGVKPNVLLSLSPLAKPDPPVH